MNQTLFTERATRALPRAFVLYEELLEDWTGAVARAAAVLDLAAVRDAPADAMRAAHEFVDRRLSRSRADWGGVELPAALRAQADEVWRARRRGRAAGEPVGARLDALRAGYVASTPRPRRSRSRRSPPGAARPPARAPRRMPAPAARVVRRYR